MRFFKEFLLTFRPRKIIRNRKSMATTVQDVLDEHSTAKYFIEYNGYLSNHLAHGVIALHRLGSPIERLNHFVQKYTTKLASPTTSEEHEIDDIDKFKGKRKSYYAILKNYQNLYEENGRNLDVLIAAEFPKLSIGLAGALLHGIIHFGYGFSVRNEHIVLEGLAYLHHSSMPIHSSFKGSFGRGDLEILDILKGIAQNEELKKAMFDGIDKDEYMSIGVGRFQRKVAYLLTEQADTLVSSLQTLKIPKELFNADGTIDIPQLARLVVKWTVIAFTINEIKNDFFLLHGVTAAWSLLQVIPLLKYDDALNAIQHFLIVLFAVYISRETPALNRPLPKARDVKPEEWETLIERAVKEDRDEHIYKLVQVCFEMAKDDADSAGLYLEAAELTTDNELAF